MKSFILINLLIILTSPTQSPVQVRSASEKTLEQYQTAAADYARQGRKQEAVEALRQVARLKPDDAMTHYQLGIELIGLGLFLEATESLSKAIQLAPTMAEAHRELCVARYNLQQYSL